jgi:hypothetical protein
MIQYQSITINKDSTHLFSRLELLLLEFVDFTGEDCLGATVESMSAMPSISIQCYSIE